MSDIQGNIVTKNIEKGTTSTVAVATATVITKLLVAHGQIPADCESYLIVALTGILVAVYDAVKHWSLTRKLVKRVKRS